MTETDSEITSTTNASKTSPGADAGIIAVHLGVMVYPVWLFGWRIPEYLGLLQQFQARLTSEAHLFAQLSQFLVANIVWSLPLLLILFLSGEVFLLKKSEGKGWRKLWLLGMILIPFGISAWAQSTFFFLLYQISG